MRLVRGNIPILWIVFAAAIALLAAPGCKFGPSENSQETEVKPSISRDARNAEFNPATAPYCVDTMSQNSTQRFHFSSLRKHIDTGESYSTDAEIAPEMIDITKRDGSSTQTSHWQRNKETGWEMAIKLIVAAGPWTQLHVAKRGITPDGMANADSFEAIKYAVDTTKEDPVEKSGELTGLGVKDYNLVGSVWLAKDTGCILKYVLDYEVDGKDGTVSKTHYEAAIRKQ